MEEIIIQLMDQWGYLAVLLLIFVENIFPPIPSEVILSFGGFMTTYTEMSLPLVILFATVGSILGALVLYLVGRLLKKERLMKLAEGKVGKILRFKPDDIRKADEWFTKRGQKTVLLCRFVPIVRSLISIPAGICEMNMGKFFLYTAIGSLAWNTILCTAGRLLGDSWQLVSQVVDQYSSIVLVILIVFVVVGGIVWFVVRGKKKETPAEVEPKASDEKEGE